MKKGEMDWSKGERRGREGGVSEEGGRGMIVEMKNEKRTYSSKFNYYFPYALSLSLLIKNIFSPISFFLSFLSSHFHYLPLTSPSLPPPCRRSHLGSSEKNKEEVIMLSILSLSPL